MKKPWEKKEKNKRYLKKQKILLFQDTVKKKKQEIGRKLSKRFI